MGHSVIYTETYVRESHSRYILSHSHSIPSYRILGVFYSNRQIAVDHFYGLDFEHIRELPCSFRDEALDGVSHSVHTCGSRQSLRQRIHQFGIHDSHTRDVVRIHAYHLSLTRLVDDDIVYCRFGSCSGCCRQRDDRQRLLLRVSYTLQSDDIAEFGVVHHNADAFRRVHA